MPTPYSPAAAAASGRRALPARHLGAVELVGDLDQDAGAVAHQLVGADRAAVVQVLQDLQPLLDDGVRLDALDVGDEADAAGVVLEIIGDRDDRHPCTTGTGRVGRRAGRPARRGCAGRPARASTSATKAGEPATQAPCTARASLGAGRIGAA
jgi:hypothetical protein